MPPASAPAANTPSVARSAGSVARPPSVGGVAGGPPPRAARQPAERGGDRRPHLHPYAAVAPLPGSARALGRLDHLPDRSLAHALRQRRLVPAVERPRARLPRRPLHHVDLRPGARLEALAALVLHRRVARVELGER